MTTGELVNIDTDELLEYLLDKDEPVMEATVFREFLAEQPWYDDQRSLYERHFSLFHALFRLKRDIALEGYYVHPDPMRMAAVPYPEKDACHHYDPEEAAFCERPAEHGAYCIMHYPEYAHLENALMYEPLREFYLDEKNIEYGESQQFNDVLNGVKTYVVHKRDVEQALEVFELEYPTRKTVQRRYRKLVKKYHPDRPGGDINRMKDINRQYALLMKVFTV